MLLLSLFDSNKDRNDELMLFPDTNLGHPGPKRAWTRHWRDKRQKKRRREDRRGKKREAEEYKTERERERRREEDA